MLSEPSGAGPEPDGHLSAAKFFATVFDPGMGKVCVEPRGENAPVGQ
jgi:hypothetical protein